MVSKVKKWQVWEKCVVPIIASLLGGLVGTIIIVSNMRDSDIQKMESDSKIEYNKVLQTKISKQEAAINRLDLLLTLIRTKQDQGNFICQDNTNFQLINKLTMEQRTLGFLLIHEAMAVKIHLGEDIFNKVSEMIDLMDRVKNICVSASYFDREFQIIHREIRNKTVADIHNNENQITF